MDKKILQRSAEEQLPVKVIDRLIDSVQISQRTGSVKLLDR